MGNVERFHKLTMRTRTNVSHRKLDSTTEQYVKTVVSESNKRYKELATPNFLQAFRSRLSKLRKIREERASAEQAISDEACDEMSKAPISASGFLKITIFTSGQLQSSANKNTAILIFF